MGAEGERPLARALLLKLSAEHRARVERWYMSETRNLSKRPLFEDWVEARLMKAADRWLRNV